jgi:hypothetical protein
VKSQPEDGGVTSSIMPALSSKKTSPASVSVQPYSLLQCYEVSMLLDQCSNNLSDIGDDSCCLSMEHDDGDSSSERVGMPFDNNGLPTGDILDEIIFTFSNPLQ